MADVTSRENTLYLWTAGRSLLIFRTVSRGRKGTEHVTFACLLEQSENIPCPLLTKNPRSRVELQKF